MTRQDKQRIQDILVRWEQWNNMYPADYINRFFHLYDDELRPVITLIKRYNRKPDALTS